MAKVNVKLRDSNSIFRDAGQRVTITGNSVFEVERTVTIHEAIRGGALVVVNGVAPKKAEPQVQREEVEHTSSKLDPAPDPQEAEVNKNGRQHKKKSKN